MRMKVKTFAFLATLIAASCVLGVLGLLTWTRTVNLAGEDVNFTVYSDAALTQVWDSGTTEDIITSFPYTETYYIRNDGNVDIKVTGAVSGTATYNWLPNSSVTIPFGGSGSLTIEFTGAGTATISFTSAAA